MKKDKKIIIIFGILVLLGLGFYFFTTLKSEPVEEVSPYTTANITVRTFQTNTLGEWGYDILIDGNIYVHQPNIPALSGDYGFKTEEDAKKVAGLVVNKIRQNILPPTISIEELQSLGVVE